MFKLFGNRTSAGDNTDKLVSGHCLMLAFHPGTDKHAMDNYTFNEHDTRDGGLLANISQWPYII